MSNVTIVSRLPSIDQLNKVLNNPVELGKLLKGTASVVRGEVVANWQSGKGANLNSLNNPAISEDYRKLKTASGRKGTIDLTLSGGLTKGFQVMQAKNGSISIRFVGSSMSPKLTAKGAKGMVQKDNVQVARALVDKRPQILTVGTKLIKNARDTFRELLKKKVSFK